MESKRTKLFLLTGFYKMVQSGDFSENIQASAAQRILAGAGVLAAGLGIAAVYGFNPLTVNFFPACPFHSLTGLNCPGCGLTRGFHALFNGDVLTALHFNALLPVYAVIISYLLISMLMLAIRGRSLSFKIFPPTFLWAFLAVSLIFGVARNLPFYPFNLLAI